MSYKVCVLLSTYNGEKYIRKQIQSILQQSYTDFRIMVRDDGSTDSTLEIIDSMKDSRINLIEAGANIGIVNSFSKLLELNAFDYFLLCDQDDIWQKNKIESQLNILTKMESEYGKNIPLMTFSDLRMINSDDQLIFHSFWEYAKIVPSKINISSLLVQPLATGCTIAGNRKLANIATPIPENVFMHDWWLSILSTAFGKIDSTRDKLIDYRIHESNRLGVGSHGIKNIQEKYIKYKEFYTATILQAEEFRKKFDTNVNSKEEELLKFLSQIKSYNRFSRLYLLFKFKVFRSNFIRSTVYYLFTFFY